LALALGVGSVAISFYLYHPGAERAPTFVVDPVRTKIIDSKLFPNSALKVTRADNVEVKGDVTSLMAYFWNDGKQSIKPGDVIGRPLTLTLEDSNAEILDYKILRVCRPKPVEVNVRPSDTNTKRELLLDFNILEENDGLSLQIIYVGNPASQLTISGVIEGARNIRSNDIVSGGQFWSELFRLLPIYFVIITGIGLIWFVQRRVALWRTSNVDGMAKESNAPRLTFSRALVFVLIGGFIVVMVFVLFVLLPRETARANVLKAVPSCIRP
jgi:hypothetical protein